MVPISVEKSSGGSARERETLLSMLNCICTTFGRGKEHFPTSTSGNVQKGIPLSSSSAIASVCRSVSSNDSLQRVCELCSLIVGIGCAKVAGGAL